MSSIMDPAKLKVAELRSELSARGLDTKGNKPVLVKRLKEALEAETEEEIAETTIPDTSTEDLETSQEETKQPEIVPEKPEEEPPQPENVPEEPPISEPESVPEEAPKSEPETVPEEASKPETENIPEEPEKVSEEPPQSEPTKTDNQPETEPMETQISEETPEAEVVNNAPKVEEVSAESEPVKSEEKSEVKMEENGEQINNEDVKTRKSRWGNEEKTEEKEADVNENNQQVVQKGEKRKHSSPSPDRQQRRRSRSPVKEDEPVIDNDKMQLSWYDSDLHLQLDKETFLSAKPLHEGAFGYAWAGVRATHGVSTGKVFYEVKITDELKFEDLSRHHDRDRNRRDHRDHRKSLSERSDHSSRDSDKKSDENDKKQSSAESENKTEEKMDETSTNENDKKTEQVEEEKMDTSETVEDKTESEKSSEVKLESSEDKIESDNKTVEKIESDNKTDEKSESDNKTTDDKSEAESEEPFPSHLLRVGWSVASSSLQLGDSKNSYGYESSGRFVSDKTFTDYAIKFGKGDVIGAFLNITDDKVTIFYTVNGEVQPDATSFDKSDDLALFPHVSSRNFAFEFNFGDADAWFALPEGCEDYVFVGKVEEKIAGPVRPENRSECEVILMCGLPAAGKTHWVNEHIEKNAEKNYTVIGDDSLLERMTVHGASLKSTFKGRWKYFMEKLDKSLGKLIDIACLRRRNYIIDQTNVFPSAQRRKLRPFEGFKRCAVVVLVEDEEYARRQALQDAEDGKDLPESSLLEMKASIALPQKSDWLDEIIFASVEETEAKELIQKYNKAGQDAGYGPRMVHRIGRRDDRWTNRRNDHRGGNKNNNYRDRNYHNRYDNRSQRSGNWNQNWNRDRRDNRGPPMGGGSRDWRNRDGGGRSHDRGSRDSHNRNQSGSYNNRSRSGGRSQGNWNSNSNSGNWSGSQGAWNQNSSYGSGSGYGGTNQNWSQPNQNQWKYGGGGSGGYGSTGSGNYGSWNYYGQYGPQQNYQQGQSVTPGATTATTTTAYNPGTAYNTQQAWAQYAQQYAQQSAASPSHQNTTTPK